MTKWRVRFLPNSKEAKVKEIIVKVKRITEIRIALHLSYPNAQICSYVQH
ncbi:MAG TPA: hypothetical protein VK927_01050 [Adhaeribacter sp.]|nr:hypothetical protein [Adhaeribacter sp.]